MTATPETVANILKEHVDGTSYESMLLNDRASPTYSIMPKRKDWRGSKVPLPFMYAPSAGVSARFGDAQASKADVSEDKWEMTTRDFFSLFSLDHKAVEQAKGSENAFIDLVESRADAAIASFKKFQHKFIFGSGGGSLGVIESGGAGGASLVLSERASMHVFDRNMQVTVSTADGGTDLNEIAVIGNINRQTRTLALLGGGIWSAGYAIGNHIHLRGTVGNALSGLASWLPLTAPGATEHYGVNRTLDSRLYGVIRTINPSIDTNIEEALINLSADVGDQGGEPDVVIMNSRALRQLVIQLGPSVVRSEMAAMDAKGEHATIGFQTIRIAVETGHIDIIGDRNCPYGTVYMLQKSACVIGSMGEPMGYLDYEDDDSKFVRHGSENAMEARLGGYSNFAIQTPGYCGVMDITELLVAEA